MKAATDLNDDLEKTALRAAQADLRRFLVDLIKAALVSIDESAVTRWREDAMTPREGLRSRVALLADHAVHLDALWVQARHEAQNDELVRAEENVKPILQSKCLFTLPELMAPDFSFEAAAARIRISTATG